MMSSSPSNKAYDEVFRKIWVIQLLALWFPLISHDFNGNSRIHQDLKWLGTCTIFSGRCWPGRVTRSKGQVSKWILPYILMRTKQCIHNIHDIQSEGQNGNEISLYSMISKVFCEDKCGVHRNLRNISIYYANAESDHLWVHDLMAWGNRFDKLGIWNQ